MASCVAGSAAGATVRAVSGTLALDARAVGLASPGVAVIWIDAMARSPSSVMRATIQVPSSSWRQPRPTCSRGALISVSRLF